MNSQIDVTGALFPDTVFDPFGEAERDVWSGREAERDEIAKLTFQDITHPGDLQADLGKVRAVLAGETVELAGYVFRFNGVSPVNGPNYTAAQARIEQIAFGSDGKPKGVTPFDAG